MGYHCNINSVLSFAILFLSINPLAVLSHNPSSPDHELSTYIIAVEPPENPNTSSDNLESWYLSFLPKTATAGSGETRMVHSYSEVFSGFAARLTGDEVEEIKKKDGFVRTFPNRRLALHTTHTPDFLGLSLRQGIWNTTNLGAGVIIGMLDTGISPTHPSFSDVGVPPPPAKWKGTCNFKSGCNKKVIGAKSYVSARSAAAMSPAPPLDLDGHGTHTASTSGGNFAPGAELFGLANGTASGMAPHAHLAIYQVCQPDCYASDILAGIDAAVKDGVDVLSLSLGGASVPFSEDVIAIGAYGAASKGIIVVCSAGNEGPESKTMSNDAPWILTVGASTVDRNLRSTVTLGNGQKIYGETLYQPHNNPITAQLPLYFTNSTCGYNDMQGKVRGKVVVCNTFEGLDATMIGQYVYDAGGVGVVIIDFAEYGYTFSLQYNVIPGSFVSHEDGSTIISYVKSLGRNATASITLDGTVLGVSPAPVVAHFSSRGPSTVTPGILKPDIIGPGFNILAAWPADAPLQEGKTGGAEKIFNIISGTSMSCPHISGVAALVKATHPNWSPAAIKSAIMTTSYSVYQDGKSILNHLHQPANFFDFGAGHVNASRVIDPGLVYDLAEGDYISYLCGLVGENATRTIVRRHDISCLKAGNITEAELNYPTILVSPSAGKTITVKRTVTNVGDASSIYTVEFDVPTSLNVRVEPQTLQFTGVNEKKSFMVSVGWSKSANISEGAQGNLKWVSKNHIVRSPVVIPPAAKTYRELNF